MPYGTFNWNYAVLVDEKLERRLGITRDESLDYWYDPINETLHITQRYVEENNDEDLSQ